MPSPSLLLPNPTLTWGLPVMHFVLLFKVNTTLTKLFFFFFLMTLLLLNQTPQTYLLQWECNSLAVSVMCKIMRLQSNYYLVLSSAAVVHHGCLELKNHMKPECEATEHTGFSLAHSLYIMWAVGPGNGCIGQYCLKSQSLWLLHYSSQQTSTHDNIPGNVGNWSPAQFWEIAPT